MDMGVLVQEFANVGFTLFICVVSVIIVNWLDRKVFNKNRRHKHDKWD